MMFFLDIKKEVADLIKKENTLKSEKVDVDQKFKTVNGKVSDCKGSIHQLHLKVKLILYYIGGSINLKEKFVVD